MIHPHRSLWPAVSAAWLLLASSSLVGAEDPLAWVRRDKIRMGWSPAKLADYEAMARAGMNAVMPRLELDADVTYDPSTAAVPRSDNDRQIVEKLRASSRKARSTGLRYFHCLDIAAQAQTWRVGFEDNPARFNDGYLPSPIDPVYWRRAIVQRVQRALDLLEGDAYALDAVIVDPEMYSLHASVPGGVDYGRFAFETYLKDRGKTGPENVDKPDARRRWLVDHKLDADYFAWQHQRTAALAGMLRRTVHARRPNAILGFIIYKNRPWFNAMAEGLSAPDRPVFIGPETTYSGVMDDSFIEYVRSVRKSVKVPCLLVPGVRMGLEGGRIPEAVNKVLPGNLYRRCQHCEGYWVWSVYRFGQGDQQRAFFSVLHRVNDALDEQAKTARLDEALRAAPLPVELPADLRERLSAAAKLRPIDAATPRQDLPFAPPRLRGIHTLVLWPRPGRDTTLAIHALKLGNLLAATTLQVFSPTGRSVWADTIAPRTSKVIRVPVREPGPYAVVISAGMNAYRIDNVSCPAMIWQGKNGVSVNARGLAGRFYFHVPAGLRQFTITVRGIKTEYADYVLRDPHGQAVQRFETVMRSTDRKIDVTAPGVWSIEVGRVIDDAGFSLVDLPNRFALRARDVFAEQCP